MEKYKSQIRFSVVLLVLLGLFFLIGEIILPFIIGLFLAYVSNPFVKRVQKLVPNWGIAVTVFLMVPLVLSIASVIFLGTHVVKDIGRLSDAFVLFTENNSEQIDETSRTIKSYIEEIYPSDAVEKSLSFDAVADSLSSNSEVIGETLSEITSFLGGSGNAEVENHRKLNWFVVFAFSILYYLYILYTYPYFDRKFQKYFGGERSENPYIHDLRTIFQEVMSTYMKQRSLIVLICAIIFMVSFSIIGLPGAIILGGMAGLLCYVSHFHYYTLLPLSLSCWVLSLEQDGSFFFFFGWVVGIFVAVSILEETVFFPYIMKGVSNMNPAIMLISLTICNYLFGTVGLLLALPLTAVALKYLDKLLMHRKRERERERASLEKA